MLSNKLITIAGFRFRLPNEEIWISSKYLNANSVHDKIKTSINKTDGKIKIDVSENYQFISFSSLNLIVKHVKSDVKVAFVAATKSHNVHKKAILSVSTAENALAISSCEADKLLVWDTRTSMCVVIRQN